MCEMEKYPEARWFYPTNFNEYLGITREQYADIYERAAKESGQPVEVCKFPMPPEYSLSSVYAYAECKRDGYWCLRAPSNVRNLSAFWAAAKRLEDAARERLTPI